MGFHAAEPLKFLFLQHAQQLDLRGNGKLADLVVIDLHQANMQPEHNTVKNLVYSGSNSNVLLTMVNGKILYENGVYHVGESPEDIIAHARAATERIINS